MRFTIIKDRNQQGTHVFVPARLSLPCWTLRALLRCPTPCLPLSDLAVTWFALPAKDSSFKTAASRHRLCNNQAAHVLHLTRPQDKSILRAASSYLRRLTPTVSWSSCCLIPKLPALDSCYCQARCFCKNPPLRLPSAHVTEAFLFGADSSTVHEALALLLAAQGIFFAPSSFSETNSVGTLACHSFFFWFFLLRLLAHLPLSF